MSLRWDRFAGTAPPNAGLDSLGPESPMLLEHALSRHCVIPHQTLPFLGGARLSFVLTQMACFGTVNPHTLCEYGFAELLGGFVERQRALVLGSLIEGVGVVLLAISSWLGWPFWLSGATLVLHFPALCAI